MKRELIYTQDGSKTIHLPELNEYYHSKHGALQEAVHVFIKNGFNEINQNTISILEMGFGTGLNAFLTLLEATKQNKSVSYTGIEAYPISFEEWQGLNYIEILNAQKFDEVYNKMYHCNWNIFTDISPNFKLQKKLKRFEEIDFCEEFDLIYFDAFGYRVQPECWETSIFKSLNKALKSNGILVTYACRTIIKKAMEEAGFKVEKLAGPPGKREMIRAKKIV